MSLPAIGLPLDAPFGPFPHLLWSRVARGHAAHLVGESTLANPPRFDIQVSPGASTAPESAARAPATLLSGFDCPPAPAPSAIVSLPSVPAVHPSVRDLFSGTAPVPTKVFELASSPWFVSGCPPGVHAHRVQPCFSWPEAKLKFWQGLPFSQTC